MVEVCSDRGGDPSRKLLIRGRNAWQGEKSRAPQLVTPLDHRANLSSGRFAVEVP